MKLQNKRDKKLLRRLKNITLRSKTVKLNLMKKVSET